MSAFRVLAIVPAAGAGARMGAAAAAPKPFLELAGRPLLVQAVEAVSRHPDVAEVCVVAAAGHVDRVRELAARYGLHKLAHVVEGGSERQESVRRALEALADRLGGFDRVLVHDAARPLLPAAVLWRVVEASRTHPAVVAALPVSDTVKRGDAERAVVETLDRRALWAAQTPQVFEPSLLLRAHRTAPRDRVATDDAALVEPFERVLLVEGAAENLKITTPADMRMAAALLLTPATAFPAAAEQRTGFGYDVHRFVAGRRLVLGGVQIDHPEGLGGHSDADVLCHAIMDALLGAVGERDIGAHFPDTDAAYRGADSLALLGRVVAILEGSGWWPVHVDATVVAERPLLAPHVPAMRARLAGALRVDQGRVSVKATTNEGLGAIGAGEGIAAFAVATVRPLYNSGQPHL